MFSVTETVTLGQPLTGAQITGYLQGMVASVEHFMLTMDDSGAVFASWQASPGSEVEMVNPLSEPSFGAMGMKGLQLDQQYTAVLLYWRHQAAGSIPALNIRRDFRAKFLLACHANHVAA